MSFLLRRNVPKAWAGWRDGFDRPDENPARQPWGRWGTTGNARVSSGRLLVPSGFDSLGGWSYEHQPFTSTWGYEYDLVDTRPSGSLAQQFGAYIKPPWSKVGYSYTNTIRVHTQYRTSIAGGPQVAVYRFDNAFSGAIVSENAGLPSDWFDTDHWVRVWVDDDRHIRVFLDGALWIYCTVPSGYEFGPGARSCNFQNGMTVDAFIDNFQLYDKPADLRWASVFYDSFDRANGAVGNGWTQLGSNAGIVSNSWSTTGTTDGGRALLRDTGVTNGRAGVEATIGGNIDIGSTQHSDLLLCSNAAGTQALAVRVNNSSISLGRYSTALTNAAPTFTSFATFNESCSNGDKIFAGVKDGYLYVNRGSERVGFAGNVHSVVPASNPWYGLRVKRQAFGNSFSWNDVRIVQPA